MGFFEGKKKSMRDEAPLSSRVSHMQYERDSSLVLALDDASVRLASGGDNGFSLARLAAAGLPVPPGVYVTAAASRQFVTGHGLQEQMLAAVWLASPEQPATCDEAARTIAALFAEHLLPDEVAQAVREASTRPGGEDLPVAVRSSATAEDLPDLSFAGQQETYLNRHGDALVLDGVKRCWASLWTARAISSRIRNQISPEDVSLAVVVQQLVPADAAGLLFTANPTMNRGRHQSMINAA